MDQQLLWLALRESIDSDLKRLSAHNVAEVSVLLFKVNVRRGRGLLCRAIMKRLLENSADAPLLASLLCIINSKLPEVGETLVARVIVQFKNAYVENNRLLVDSTLLFLCELVLQGVVEEVILLQVLQVLLDKSPTDDSIRTASNVLERTGAYLERVLISAAQIVFDRLRTLLQDGKLLHVSQRRITELMRLRRAGLTLRVDPALDLVLSDDKQTQFVDLSEKQDPELELNYFRYDSDFEAAETEYAEEIKQILPEVEEEEKEELATEAQEAEKVTDFTDAELLAKQKTIYLTIMSSMSADEAVHKLMKLKRAQRLDNDLLIDMIIKCCAQEKTYSKYFGVIGEKICRMSRHWHDTFVGQFQQKYSTIYQYEGAQLRNIGKFFGHLLAADILEPQNTLGCIVLTEKDTTSAGRVFIKFLFQALVEELGIDELQQILHDDELRGYIQGMFPVVDATTDDESHLLFSINYFTAIGLGVLTQEMREILKSLPPPRGRSRGRSDVDLQGSRSRSGSSSGSYSRSRSGSYSRSRSGSYSRSRSGSYSRSGSESRSRSRSRSRSGSRARLGSRSRSRSYSRSRSSSR